MERLLMLDNLECKRRIMKLTPFILGLLLLIGFAGCKSRKDALETTTTTATVPEHPESIIAEDFSAYKNGASTTISSVTIEKNVMIINVSYSGGCEKHEFKLIGSKLIQKSLPPKRGIMLYHTNNGDSCRSIVEEELRFNITNLSYEGKEMVLILEGWATQISYIPVQ